MQPSEAICARTTTRRHWFADGAALIKRSIPQFFAMAYALVTTIALAQSEPAEIARPKASAICELLVGTIQAKRATCCDQAGAADLLDLCNTTLKPIKRQLQLDASAWQRCASDLSAFTNDCAFVQQQLPPLPLSCRGIVQGTLPKGASCGSSLSCQDGLYCLGLSVGKSGVCSKPVAVGARCESAHDSLAGILGLNDLPEHRSCQGRCERGFCLATADQGGSCQHSGQCRESLQCVSGSCQVANPAAPGATCDASHFCEFGSTCQDGRCQFRKPGGASCRIGFECASFACEKAEGAELGVCAAVCPRAG